MLDVHAVVSVRFDMRGNILIGCRVGGMLAPVETGLAVPHPRPPVKALAGRRAGEVALDRTERSPDHRW